MIKKLCGFARISFFMTVFFFYSLIGFAFGIIGKSNEFLRGNAKPMFKLLLWVTGSKVEKVGLEHFKTDRNYILIGNHRSYADIMALFVASYEVGTDITFLAKRELFMVPIFGKVLRTVGILSVDKNQAGKSNNIRASINKSIEILKEGKNLVIFAEGTRSIDGHTLSAFKPGGFLIAKKAEVDILPFAIEGSENYMKKGSFLIQPAVMKITFAPPIQIAEKSEKELMAETETVVRTLLNQPKEDDASLKESKSE